MKINLISENEYIILYNIFQTRDNLTLQNKGYENIDTKKLSNIDILEIKEVERILRKSIYGFSKFQNFRLTKGSKIQIRLQYNYNYESGIPFIGVGYILLDELRNGFN